MWMSVLMVLVNAIKTATTILDRTLALVTLATHSMMMDCVVMVTQSRYYEYMLLYSIVIGPLL